MLTRIIIGNAVSLFAACFLFASSAGKTVKRIYLLQIFECLILVIAQIIFGAPEAVFALLVSAMRNTLLVMEKYTRTAMLLVAALSFALGILFYSGTLAGLLPPLATSVYSASCYFAKSFTAVKLSLAFNLFVWCIYSFLIFDFVSFSVNLVSLIIALISLFSLRGQK